VTILASTALLLPSWAGAATVTVADNVIEFRAEPGELNRLTISFLPDAGTAEKQVVLADEGAEITA